MKQKRGTYQKRSTYQIWNWLLILFAFVILNLEDQSHLIIPSDSIRTVVGFVLAFIAVACLVGSDWIFHNRTK